MKNTIFKGAATALITPFNDDKTINYEEFGKIIDFQIENGVDALVVCGTTGEPSTMPDEEHIEAMRFAIEYTNKRVPVIAGTGSNDTDYCIELSKKAEDMGADALIVIRCYKKHCIAANFTCEFSKIDSVSCIV